MEYITTANVLVVVFLALGLLLMFVSYWLASVALFPPGRCVLQGAAGDRVEEDRNDRSRRVFRSASAAGAIAPLLEGWLAWHRPLCRKRGRDTLAFRGTGFDGTWRPGGRRMARTVPAPAAGERAIAPGGRGHRVAKLPESLRGSPSCAAIESLDDLSLGRGASNAFTRELAALYGSHRGPLGEAGGQSLAALERIEAAQGARLISQPMGRCTIGMDSRGAAVGRPAGPSPRRRAGCHARC